MPVRGEATSAKKEVEEVIRDLSRVVRGRAERSEAMEMRVEEITPVLEGVRLSVCGILIIVGLKCICWK